MSERIKMTMFDRAVAFVAPGFAYKRMQAKERLRQFGYGDNPHHRGDSGGQSRNAGSETYAKGRERIQAMWDARDLVEYDWIGGALGRVVLYVVGQLECKSNTGDPEVDALYDDYFHNWCGDEEDDDGMTRCDVSGRHRLVKLAQLGLLGMFVDGDHGWVLVDTDDGDQRELKLLPVEADRIGSPLDAQQREDYIGGFTIDVATGRMTSVRVYERSRMGQYRNPVEVEPAKFIHLVDPARTDQFRGKTALLRLLEDCRDIKETLEAEKVAIKDQSQYSAFVGSKDGGTGRDGDAWSGKKTKAGTPTQDAVWGKILRMAEGETFQFATPSARPSGAFMAFMQILIRKMAISLGLSYGFLWDLSMLGGVSQRVEVRGDERKITYWQALLINKFLRRVRRAVLDYGVTYHDLPAHPNMHKCTWHFGERIITDAGYEIGNDIQLLSAGLVSADDVATKYATNGGNLRDVLQRNAAAVKAAQEIAALTGVPIELLAPVLWPNATQMLAAMNTPPELVTPPPPEPGSLEAVGDKGAAQIVDILSRVATGQLDRDSAINTLTTVYGLYPEQAGQIVPSKVIKQPNPNDEDRII